MAVGPANKDIEYYSGDELDKTFQVAKGGLSIDMSSDVLLMHVKRKKTDPLSKAVAVLSSAGDTITVFGDDGDYYTLSGKYVLDQDVYYYDIERTNVDETTQFGKFIVTGDVTREE